MEENVLQRGAAVESYRCGGEASAAAVVAKSATQPYLHIRTGSKHASNNTLGVAAPVLLQRLLGHQFQSQGSRGLERRIVALCMQVQPNLRLAR